MKKLVLLGKLPTKHFAPFDNPEYEIWQINNHGFDTPKRVDKKVDIHSFGNRSYDINFDNFPFKECHELVGGNYFNNTVSYLIAYAVLLGYKEIYFYGCQFRSYQESRTNQYENVRELMFFAMGKGIKFYAPCDKIMVKEYKPYINWRCE